MRVMTTSIFPYCQHGKRIPLKAQLKQYSHDKSIIFTLYLNHFQADKSTVGV